MRSIKEWAGFVSFLALIIVSLTTYSYSRDVNGLTTAIKTEKEERIKSDDDIKSSIAVNKSANDLQHQDFTTTKEFKEYKEGIKTILTYIQASDKEKRDLQRQIEELRTKNGG